MSDAAQKALTRFINVAGGISVEDARQRADNAIAFMRADALLDIDASIDGLGRHLAGLGPTPSDSDKLTLYRLANSVASIAAMFGLRGLGQAAYSLCELVDGLRAGGVWDGEAIELHYCAMRLMRQPHDFSEADQERLLAGLHRVAQRWATLAN